jgi:hypothetical protein
MAAVERNDQVHVRATPNWRWFETGAPQKISTIKAEK